MSILLILSGKSDDTMFTIDEILAPPKTFSDVVAYLDTVFGDSTKNQIRRMTKEEAKQLHFCFGTQVQNALGLHGDNPELLADCRMTDADAASQWILYALWFMLKTEA